MSGESTGTGVVFPSATGPENETVMAVFVGTSCAPAAGDVRTDNPRPVAEEDPEPDPDPPPPDVDRPAPPDPDEDEDDVVGAGELITFTNRMTSAMRTAAPAASPSGRIRHGINPRESAASIASALVASRLHTRRRTA